LTIFSSILGFKVCLKKKKSKAQSSGAGAGALLKLQKYFKEECRDGS